jgi:hypothetical protein
MTTAASYLTTGNQFALIVDQVLAKMVKEETATPFS